MVVSKVESGWYPDPDGKPCDRYWNGSNWTKKTRPLSSSSASIKSKGKKSIGPIIAVVAVLVIGGVIVLAVAIDNANKSIDSKVRNYTESRYGSSQRIEDMANQLGTKTYSQRVNELPPLMQVVCENNGGVWMTSVLAPKGECVGGN